MGARTTKISLHFRVRVTNLFIKNLLRIGVPVGPTTLLTVRGRKTGIRRTSPVEFLKHDGRYYVLGWFGDSNWCRNLRVEPEALVGIGMRRREVIAEEIKDKEEWARVLREILAPFLASRMGSSILKMGFELTKDSTLEDYAREAIRHPGFIVRFKEKP